MDEERAIPAIERAGHALSGYVTHGMVADVDFISTFELLAATVPRELATCPSRVYRVLVLVAEKHADLEAGRTVVLEPRPFGSWTKSLDSAHAYLRKRSFGAQPGSRLVVTAKDVDPGCCVVDVEAVYRALSWDHPDVDEWDRYVLREKEVVLRQDAGMLLVRPEDVVLSLDPSDVRAVEPRSGERIWLDEEGDFVDVASVGAVEEAEGDRVWTVLCADGSERTVFWDHRQDCWEARPPEPSLGSASAAPV